MESIKCCHLHFLLCQAAALHRRLMHPPFYLLQRSLHDPALLAPEKLLVKIENELLVLSADRPVPSIFHRFCCSVEVKELQ